MNEENEAGYRNGELLGGLIVIEWQMDITPATLANAYSKINDHLTHYTQLQLEHRQLAGRMTEQDRNAILHAITSRGLKDTGDDQLANFNSIAKYLMDKNMPITAGNIDMVLPNIVSSCQYRLTWKKCLQDSAREAQAAREAAKQQQPVKKADDEVKIPAGLPPHLHERYRQTHKKVQVATPFTQASTQSHFESMARSAAASIQSNVDRAEASDW